MFRLNPFYPGGIVLRPSYSLAFPALADVNEETMVVTASATEQNVKDAPASISVITQQDLQRKPVQNLKDVLRDVPGVQLTNEGDNRKGVSIRGLSSSYTLILVDGKRVNSRNAVFRHNDFDLTGSRWIPLSVSKWCAARCRPLRLRCARWGGQHYYQKNRPEMDRDAEC